MGWKPQEIADQLTPQERHAVMLFKHNYLGRHRRFPFFRDKGVMLRRMVALGIASRKGIITKLGLEVRAILEAQNDTQTAEKA